LRGIVGDILMIDFKKIPDSDKPRERLYMYGSENLSNEELISIILKTGTKKMSVKEVALKLLEEVGDIDKFKDIGINTLMKIDGIGKVKAIEIKAALEFGRRVYKNNNDIDRIKFNSAEVIYSYFFDILGDKKQEYFYCVYVDTKSKYIDKKCLFVGTINSSVVHPREVFKEAYLLSASGIICVHNHPSGDSNPSKEDIMITKKLKEIGIIHGIKILDHVIVGNGNYFSFYDNNML
jgi:DNA repair protein RadC